MLNYCCKNQCYDDDYDRLLNKIGKNMMIYDLEISNFTIMDDYYYRDDI